MAYQYPIYFDVNGDCTAHGGTSSVNAIMYVGSSKTYSKEIGAFSVRRHTWIKNADVDVFYLYLDGEKIKTIYFDKKNKEFFIKKRNKNVLI